jgi:hypothetical protein
MHGFLHVSREELESILTEGIAALRPELLKPCDHYAVRPFRQPGLRDRNCVFEQVFFVGKHENRLLYYDDVEEDFGVTILDEDGC